MSSDPAFFQTGSSQRLARPAGPDSDRVVETAIGAEKDSEQARRLGGRHNDRACPIAEKRHRGWVSLVNPPGEDIGPITNTAFRLLSAYADAGRAHKGIRRTRRPDRRAGSGQTEPMCNERRRGRQQMIRRAGGEQEQADVIGVEFRSPQRMLRRPDSEVGRGFCR